MSKEKRTPSPRRNFSVKGQLVGKLGPRGYGRLLDQLAKVTVKSAAKSSVKVAVKP